MKKHLGFTLIEVIIVISILSFLILMVAYLSRKQIFKGYDAKRKADLHRIQIAIEEYEKDHDCYPTEELLECNPGTGLQPYLTKIPCDPETNESYVFEIPESECPNWYILYSNLANSETSICSLGCGPGYSYNFYVSSPNAPDPETSPESSFNPNPITFGCFSGTCAQVPTGSSCQPTFNNSGCYGACTDGLGNPQNECQ